MTPYEIAKTQLGVKEIQGGENPKIIDYFTATHFHAKEDEVPWCSAFVNWCYKQAGLHGSEEANAKSWLNWEDGLKKPVEGCVVVLKRGNNPASGHVGFYVCELDDRIKVLGGNQSDQVKYSWFPKSDVLSYRS